MAEWRSSFHAVVASDVSDRDGLGWEFTSTQGRIPVWSVFREDGGAFPVFSAARGLGALPSPEQLRAMTVEAVSDLMDAAGLADHDRWMSANIAGALLFASRDVLSWEGEEWALESAEGDVPISWAEPGSPRVPFAWLRARCTDSASVIDIYQDDANFGLSFVPTPGVDRRLPTHDDVSLRSHRQVELARGKVSAVDVVYDTTVDGGACPGLVTEVLLHAGSSTTLVIAAEAYSRDEWHLYDESVVALSSIEAADALEWVPPRKSWRPTRH